MRKTICFVLAIVCSLVLSSCGVSSPPNEAHIKEDLIEAGISSISIDNPFSEYNDYSEFEIQSIEIEKRQTNDKDDTVYCIVSMENEWYYLEKNLILFYTYYDQGGWILDNYSDSGDITWKIIKSPFTSETAEQLKANTYYYYEYVENPAIEENLTEGVVIYSFPVEETHTYGSYRGNYIYRLIFNGYEWGCVEDNSVSFVWNIAGHRWRYLEETPSSGIFSSSKTDVSISVTDVDNYSQLLQGTWSIIIDNPSRLLYDYEFSSSLSGNDIVTEFYSNRIELAYAMYSNVTPVSKFLSAHRPLKKRMVRAKMNGVRIFCRFGRHPLNHQKYSRSFSTIKCCEFTHNWLNL